MITTPCIFVFANHAHSVFESHRDHRVERRPKGGNESGPSGLIFRSSSSEQGPLGRRRAPTAGRPGAEAFWMEEPHNRRVKGRLRREDSRGFQEALAHRFQTQREAAGQWEKAAPAPGRVLHVQYLLPSTRPHGPHGPRCGRASTRATIRLRAGTPAPGLPAALRPSASGPRRKPEKKWDPDSPCHLLRQLLR